MKTNELIEIKETAMSTTDLKNKKLATSVKKIQTGIANIKKNALAIAEQLYNIKQEELYKDDYETLKDFLVQTGFSTTRGYRLIKVWEKLKETNGALDTFNASQIEELIKVDSVDIEVAIEENVINSDMSTKELRKFAEMVTTNSNADLEETLEKTEKETVAESDYTTLKIGKDGYKVKATEEEILKYLHNKFQFV